METDSTTLSAPAELDNPPMWPHPSVADALNLPREALRDVSLRVNLGAFPTSQLNAFRDAIKSRLWFRSYQGWRMAQFLFPHVEVYRMDKFLAHDGHFHYQAPSDVPWTPEGRDTITAYMAAWQVTSETDWQSPARWRSREGSFMLDHTMSPVRARKFMEPLMFPRENRGDRAAEQALEAISNRGVIECTLAPRE